MNLDFKKICMKDGRTYGHNCHRNSCAVESLLARKDEGSHEVSKFFVFLSDS